MRKTMPKLILASQSPRRRELLEQIGLSFQVQPADINESIHDGEGARDFVERMAREKAWAVADRHPDEWVIGSDTAVVLDDQVMGKPVDQSHAAEMLMALSGRQHQVMSSVALVTPTATTSLVSVSEVSFRCITEAEAAAYWATGEPVDKAGGYAIQGLAAIFIEQLSGSYSGVMGLPLYETATLLRRVGLDPLRQADIT